MKKSQKLSRLNHLIPVVLILIIFSTTIQTQGAASILIPTGAVWKYLDDGSDQGTAWIQPIFNDSGWRSGCAQLGYGDGDECTTVGYGPDPQRKYITTYFRGQFNVTNATQYIALSLQLLRDDGAVVYLNGTEIFRNNMPATGAILFNTTASASAAENYYIPALVCGVPLQEGMNTVAVEVHQVNANSSDISFDLALEGLRAIAPTVQLAQPEEGARFAEGGNVSVLVNAPQACGSARAVEVYEGATRIGQSSSAPFQMTWTNPPLGNHTIYAVGINEFGTRSTSGPVNIRVLVSDNIALVPAHSDWKYLDNGSDQGTIWTGLAFDDSGWSNGVAELGYGDADEGRPEATVVGYGPDANNKYITTYFRRVFTATNAELLPLLALRVLRDDGVVVYLNGAEVLRNNLPATGPITYTTPAAPSVGGSDETNWIQTCISPTLVANGLNVIAAEIHQAFGESSDISFDLELITAAAAAPKLTIARDANVVSICWPRWAECYALQSSDRASVAGNWQPVLASIFQTADANCVMLPISGNTAFYRLKVR